MKVTIRIQRRCWAAEKHAEEAQPVWKPTDESFLSTLIGCSQEESEGPTEEEIEAAEIAELLAKEIADAEPAEEADTVIPEPATAEEIPIAAAAMQTEIPAAMPFLSSWTFQNTTTLFPKVGLENAIADAAVDAAGVVEAEEAPAPPAADEQHNIVTCEVAPAVESCPEPAVMVVEEAKPQFANYTSEGDESENTVEDVPAPEISSVVAETVAQDVMEVRTEDVLAATAREAQESIAALELASTVETREKSEPIAAAAVESTAIAIPGGEAASQMAPAPVESRAPLFMPYRSEAAAAAAPGVLVRAWRWINKNHALGAKKQLRVAETVSLGDKRFVAVVHVDGQKFLIGGGSAGVSLLTSLGGLTQASDAAPALSAARSELA